MRRPCARDDELERRILDEVGSYGRQIGRIADVVSILLDKLPPGSVTPKEQDMIDDFRFQVRKIRELKP